MPGSPLTWNACQTMYSCPRTQPLLTCIELMIHAACGGRALLVAVTLHAAHAWLAEVAKRPAALLQ